MNKTILDDAKIRDLIEHFSSRKLGNNDYPADLMGDAYEILLKQFADESKKKAGEFYTPRSVVRLLVRILDPQPGESVYDPACGSGGMLIEAIRYMHNDSLCCGAIYGQEKNVTNAAIAKMNLFLHGASDFNVRQGDTLREPKILSGDHLARFHCVLANPPFSLEQWGATEWKNDMYGRNLYGTPNDSNGDYAWIQHMVASMKPVVGRMAVVLPQGVLFRGDTEQRIREKLIREDKIEAVVTLGDKLFYGTGLSPCFLVLRAQKPTAHVNRILMVDGTKILTKRRAQNVLEESDVDRLYKLYHNYRDEEDFARVVTNDDVLKKDCNLSPNRYIQYHQAERESYDEVLAQFKAAVERVNKAEAAYRRTMA